MSWTTTANAAISFGSATNYPVANGPEAVAISDFNGDGKKDLAVASEATSAVSILLGGNGGTFGAASNYAAGPGPTAVKSGDFNNDGKVDLIVVNGGFGNEVSILLGNGNGTFQNRVAISTAMAARDVVVGDFNNDGNQDFAATGDSEERVAVRLGNGNGTFQNRVDYVTGGFPIGIASGDLNRDGKLDLVTANSTANTVSVLLGVGDGTFGAKTDYATGPGPRHVVIASLNGVLNSSQDVAVTNQAGGSISVLPGNGSGSLGTKTDYAIGNNPDGVIAADFDSDSYLDLAATNMNDNTVSVLRGNGINFGARTTFATGGGPSGIAASDLDGTAGADIVTANWSGNTVSVLLSQIIRLAISDTSMSFGTVTVGSKSPRSITLTNTGTQTLSDISVSIYAPFFLAGNSCSTLGPGKVCKIELEFAPTSAGDVSDSMTIYYNGYSGHESVRLEGTAIVDLGPGNATADPGNTPVECPLQDIRCQFLGYSIFKNTISEEDLIKRGIKVTVYCNGSTQKCTTTILLYGSTDFSKLLGPSHKKGFVAKKKRTKQVLLAKKTVTIDAGKSEKITLKLTKTGKKLIKKLKKNTTLQLVTKTKTSNGKSDSYKSKLKVKIETR